LVKCSAQGAAEKFRRGSAGFRAPGRKDRPRHLEGNMTEYVLRVNNQSTNFFDFCVFQRMPDTTVRDVFSLAWFAQPAHPTTTLTFRWTIDYSFVWNEPGKLVPGVVFDDSQTWDADPADPALNTVGLDYIDGAFTFERKPGTANNGLYIKQGPEVPADTAGVGIGMSGNGTYLVQAQPNLELVFQPHPNYWVAAGTFTEGQILDLETITNVAEVAYADNVYDVTATLQGDNSWDVQPTSR
jgi:hypothetical protein